MLIKRSKKMRHLKKLKKHKILYQKLLKVLETYLISYISAVILKFGMEVAVSDLCEKSSNSEINLTSKAINITRFDQNFEIKIFNIINELVNNILKHSKAKNGTVKLDQLNGELQVVVFDDGIGFDVSEIQKKNGIGLSQVEARIKVLGGIIKFNNNKGNGTRIYISVPIIY